jgi:NADH-quinone oxidoreductase subunit G
VSDGGSIGVSTDAGTIVLPVVVTDMPDHVVWVPTNAAGLGVRDALHADAGDIVRLAPAGRQLQTEEARA